MLDILEDEIDPNSYGYLDATSKDVINGNKLHKVVHCAMEDIFLHSLEETQGQNNGNTIVFETLPNPFSFLIFLVGKK